VVLADARGKSAAAAEAEELAAQGYMVLAPDLRGFGETQPHSDRRDSFVRNFGDYESAMTALLIGKTMAGMRATDVSAAVAVLAARADADATRLSVIGRGPAAIPALLATLFDDRVKGLAVDGMLVSYDAVISEHLHQGIVEQVIPSALKYFDLPDVISAIAPRRVAIYNGVNPLGQELTLRRLREQYAGVKGSPLISVRDREEQPFVPVVEPFLASTAAADRR
jgi:pimeloyl-ACP methyl ester carboxylesterase